jgi:NADPH-dependent curcumin reductase CurA
VGGTAVQLAVSAGYEVVSTSSPANFDHVKKLGASYVFDYKSMTLGEDLIDAVAGRQLCGCFSIGDGTADIFADVLTRHAGPAPTVKRIARAEGKHSVAEDSGILVGFIINGIGAEDPTRPVFEDFLPGALASGQFVPAPKAVVVGTGLDKLQEAFTRLKQGVSAQKMVVRLPAGDGAS